MSTNARISLIGLYNYNNALFDELVLPSGYDKNVFINALLLEHGEKCVIYPNYDFMKFSIGVLSKKWYHELERVYLALTEDYNPLHNYDRYEHFDDTSREENNGLTTAWKGGGSTRTNKPEYFDEQTVNGYTNQTLDSTTETVTDAKTTEKVSAFNSSNFEPSKEITENGGKQKSNAGKLESNSGTMKHHGTTEDISENFGENSNGTTTDTKTATAGHDAHLYGNIGVTTSQQMMADEIKARQDLNIYAVAAGIFANELLIQVY